MAIKQRQKDIINPFAKDAEKYNSSERSAVGYEYDNSRNKFVLDAIHDSFRNLGFFPEIGTVMEPIGPLQNLNNDERALTETDALAYCALYPQNAKIVAGKFKLLSDDEIYQQLKKIANILASEQVSESYETVTTSEAQFIENQTIIPSNTGREKITYNSLEEQVAAARKQTVARLMSIPPVHSSKYVNSLRESLGLPETSYEIDDNLYLYKNSGLIPYTSQNSNVDLYDWRNNADPGTETTKVYYNPIDDNYYYIIRTTSTNPKDYVVSYGGNWSLNDNTIPNLKNVLRDGVDEILKFTQKYSDVNRTAFISIVPTREQLLLSMVRGSFLESNDKLSILTYMDDRPSSPWIACVRVPRVQLDSLPGGFEISYEEFEMTPYEKSRVIISQDKPEYRLPIQVDSLIGKLAATKKVLKRYLRDIINENIPKKMLKNVDIEREVDNLHNFINYLQLLYNYNRIPLEDDDLVEFYLSETFQLMYMTINGNLITRGIGNDNFIKGDSDDVVILDAFGLMSPTSFSFLFYSPYIFKEYLEKQDASGRSWVDFLGTYMYPPLDTTALSTQLQANKEKDASLLNEKRQQNVFQKLSEISRIPSQSIEQMYFDRPLRYKLENLESNIQCSTAQARYTKYALGIAKAFTTQTKIKSITRQVILILKNEVISDAVKRAKINIDGQELGLQDAENLGFRYADNPELIRRDIEKYVNQKIFCSLDAIGDFIEDSFLDPIGAPPAANDLVRATLDPPIKFEFKERPEFSLVDGRRKAYEKAVNAIVENFLNALLAGIIRDLINAFLGCGPNTTPEDEQELKNSAGQVNYGGVEIREFLSDTDIVEKATEAGLVSQAPEGDVEVSFQQMSKFLDDVSKIVTPSEATTLLRGDAPGYLYQVILEMISRRQPIPISRDTEIITQSYRIINFDADNLNVYFELLGAGDPTTEAYSSINPVQSYCDDKDVLASDLGLDFLPEEQLIVQFDEAMQNKMLKISFFCDFLRNALDFQAELDKLMDLIPSMGWYDDLLDSIAEFSNFLVDKLAELLSGEGENQNPYPPANASNFYTTQFGTQTFWGVSALFTELLTTTQVGNSSLQGAPESDAMWLQIGTLPRETFSLQDQNSYSWLQKFGIPNNRRADWLRLPLLGYTDFRTSNAIGEVSQAKFSQTYGTPAQISAARENDRYHTEENRKIRMPRLALVFRGSSETEEQRENRVIKNAGIGFSIVDIAGVPPLYSPNKYDGPLIASDPLIGRENPQDLFGTFESALPEINYSILNSFFMDNLSYSNPGTAVISSANDAAKNTRSQFAMNINAWGGSLQPGDGVGGPEQTPERPNEDYPKRDSNLLLFGNAYRLNEKIIESFYTAPTLAPRRLPPFVRAVNKFPFELVDDKCVTAQEEQIASSIVSSVQARIARLMFNSGPLLQSYGTWGSDGTLYLLSDYLLRKLEREYSQRKLIGVIYDNFDIIEKAYSDPSRNLNRDFRFYSSRTPRENLRVLIRCVLYRVLDNIAEGTEYPSANKSIFEGEGRERFVRLVRSYFQRMVEYYTDQNPQPDKAQEFQALIDTGFGPNADEAQYFQAGAYFFPVAQLFAAYIIMWDMAGLSTAVKALDLQLSSQAAEADDSILTAVNGVLSTQFGFNFSGFPVTIRDYEGTLRTYYSREETRERVQYLETTVTNLENTEMPPPFLTLCGYSETALQDFLKDTTGFDYQAVVANLWDNGWEERNIHGRGDPGVETKGAAQNLYRTMIHERMQTLCNMYNAPDITAAFEILNSTYRAGQNISDEEFTDRYTTYTTQGYSTLEPTLFTSREYFETMQKILSQAGSFAYGGFPDPGVGRVDPYDHIRLVILRAVDGVFATDLKNLYLTGPIDEIQINIASIQEEINILSRYI